MLGVIVAKGLLPEISAIKYRAPEITEEKTDGIFSFAPGPVVTRETLVPLLDSMNLVKGDIVMELACRIDTKTIWTEVKKRGCTSSTVVLTFGTTLFSTLTFLRR